MISSQPALLRSRSACDTSLRLMPPRPAADAALTHTGERVVGGVLPRIGIGDGVCVTVYVSFFSAGAGTVWGVWFFSSFWDRVWAE